MVLVVVGGCPLVKNRRLVVMLVLVECEEVEDGGGQA